MVLAYKPYTKTFVNYNGRMGFKMKKIAFFIGVIFTLFSSVASATWVFDFDADNLGVADSTAYNSLSMTVDGLTVDISAYTIVNDGSGNISSMTKLTGNGVGVYVSGGHNLGVVSSTSGDSHSLDGGYTAGDPDEGIMFSFSRSVSLEYINFDKFHLHQSDDFNLTVDGKKVLTDFHGSHSSPLASQVPGEYDEYSFNNIQGKEFLFWADSDSDSFRIDEIHVSEPLSVLLFGMGLLGLGLQRRRVVK